MAQVNLGRVRGEQGIPGAPGRDGTDGKSVWVKYNSAAQDAGASDVWRSGLNYIGVQTAAGESKPATGYQWSLFIPDAVIPVDALTSTRTDLPLSANQGRVLKSLIDNAVTANGDIAGGTHCKITYDRKGLVTGGTSLTAADLPVGLIEAGSNINVSRNASGIYTVSSPTEKLIGYRYGRQDIPTGSTNSSFTYNSSALTMNKGKGKIQVLFLRLNQSGTNYSIDIPVELLVLMSHTQQKLEVLNASSEVICMQVISCTASRYSVSHPYMDINVTARFTYASRGGITSYSALRAEWWGRVLEPITDATGY